MKIKHIFFLIFMLALFGSLVNKSNELPSSIISPIGESSSDQFVDVMRNVNMSSYIQFLNYFSTLESRVTCYPGYEEAAEYIYKSFNEFGLSDVEYNYYNITIPMDYGATLTVLGNNTVIPAFPLWPNGVQTCSANVTGELIYAKKGEWVDFNAQKVNGSIVLMDFNSEDHWLRAAELGAKAVVFLETTDTWLYESNLKSLVYTPLDFPRVYVQAAEAERLITLSKTGKNVMVRLVSNMQYEKKVAKNVIGYINGTDPNPSVREQIIIVCSNFDSFSVIPSVAPGISEACGAASLLEAAKYFSKNPLPKTLMFIAFSGYGENEAGVKEFLNDFVWREKNLELADRFVSAIELYITPENKNVAFSFVSHGIGTVDNWYSTFYQQFIFKIEEAWQKLYKFEPALVEGYPGMAVASPLIPANPAIVTDGQMLGAANIFTTIQETGHSWYHYRRTPIDALDKYPDILNNVKTQLEVFFCHIFDQAISLPEKPLNPFDRAKAIDVGTAGAVTGGGFGIIVGQAVEYDPTTAWYKPIPNAIVLVRATGPSGTVICTVIITDENGLFHYNDLTTQRGTVTRFYSVDTYVVNQTMGEIIYMPDRGQYAATYSTTVELTKVGYVGTYDYPRQFVAFKNGGSLIIYDYTAAQMFAPVTTVSFEVASTGVLTPILSINGIQKHILPDHYYYFTEGPLAMFFLPSSFPVEMILGYANQPPLAILINADEQHPEGKGFQVEAGEQMSIFNTPLKSASDLYFLDDARLKLANSFTLYTGSEDYHDEAKRDLNEAQNALNNNSYNIFYSTAINALTLERQVYSLTLESMQNAINTAAFFFAEFIPCAYVLEQLIFKKTKGSRILIYTILIFILFLIIMTIFHPGFRMASSVYITFLGLTIATLTLPIIVILIKNSLGIFATLRLKVIGPHFAESARTSAIITSFSNGLSQMRKHRFRTILTSISLIIITTTLIIFTSISPLTNVRTYSQTGTAEYSGVYIRNLDWSSLNKWFVDDVESSYISSTICRRSVSYTTGGMARTLGFKLFSSSGEQTQISAIYGITPEDGEVTGWSKFIIEGSFLTPNIIYQAVVTDSIAKSLGVKVWDTIFLEGLPLRLVGIIDTSANSLIDLDQHQATPRDPEVVTGIGFFSIDRLIFIPYALSLRLGATLYSFTISSGNKEQIVNAAISLARRPLLQVYSATNPGEKSIIYQYSIAKGISSYGYSLFIMPLLVMVVSVFNMVLSTIYERSNEIKVLNIIGLSPTGVAGFFLIEIITYAIVSTLVGYSIGIIMLSLLNNYGDLPQGFYPNYSSTFQLFSTGLIIAAVVATSIYPLYKASRMVTPSLERKWKLTTKPLEDQWSIPLPFVSLYEAEAYGVLMFLKEYISAFTNETGAQFITREISYQEGKQEERIIKSLDITLSLAPFTAGINQKTRLMMVYNPEEKRWASVALITRLTGEYGKWEKSNYTFIDIIRKQFLQWRGLPPSERERYMKSMRLFF